MVFTSLLCNKIKIQKEQEGWAKEKKEDKDEERNEKKEAKKTVQ